MSESRNPAGANGGVSEGSPSAKQIVPEHNPAPRPRQAARKITPAERREYILSELRLAVSYADVERNNLATLGVAFKAGMITEDWTLVELRQSPFFRPLVDGGIV